jgi:hypothetical protein
MDLWASWGGDGRRGSGDGPGTKLGVLQKPAIEYDEVAGSATLGDFLFLRRRKVR